VNVEGLRHSSNIMQTLILNLNVLIQVKTLKKR